MEHELFVQKILKMAEEEGFAEAAVIPVTDLVFVPEYRKYCEENRCGNYGRNYACPPYSGTVDKMRARTEKYQWALVLKSDHSVENAMNGAEMKPLKKAHNTMTRQLTGKFQEAGLIEDGLSIMAGPCNFCTECKMPKGEPCPFETKRFSCLSAYCIDVGHLSKSAGMKLSWDLDKASFFSMYLFT